VKRKVSTFFIACIVVVCASFSQGQQPGQLNASLAPDTSVTYPDSAVAPTPATGDAPDPAPAPAPAPVPMPQSLGSGPLGGSGMDDQWHISVSPYLWFAGVHGTVGALGRDVGFKASASDLLSKARFGILGAADIRRDRILATGDLMYLYLKDNKALPFPGLGSPSADLSANVFLLTPKVGVRVINKDKLKADFLAGIRYWYFGETLQFSPSALGLNFSRSQSWVDPLVGGRIQAALSSKVIATIAGDVGGWGTGSQLEYQAVGLLGYKLKPKVTLQAGYRYLYADYEKSGRLGPTTVKLTMSGIVIGATLNLK
jgi:hypothetical protein